MALRRCGLHCNLLAQRESGRDTPLSPLPNRLRFTARQWCTFGAGSCRQIHVKRAHQENPRWWIFAVGCNAGILVADRREGYRDLTGCRGVPCVLFLFFDVDCNERIYNPDVASLIPSSTISCVFAVIVLGQPNYQYRYI